MSSGGFSDLLKSDKFVTDPSNPMACGNSKPSFCESWRRLGRRGGEQKWCLHLPSFAASQVTTIHYYCITRYENASLTQCLCKILSHSRVSKVHEVEESWEQLKLPVFSSLSLLDYVGSINFVSAHCAEASIFKGKSSTKCFSFAEETGCRR